MKNIDLFEKYRFKIKGPESISKIIGSIPRKKKSSLLSWEL